MIIVMKPDATKEQIESVKGRVSQDGFKAHESAGVDHTIIGVIGQNKGYDTRVYGLLEGVYKVVKVSTPFKLTSRAFKQTNTVIDLGTCTIGTDEIAMIAGPCTIEDKSQMDESAAALKEIGCQILRGGAYKPRTSPYSFQGHGEKGLQLIREAADKYGLKVISEILDASQIEVAMDYVDIIQVGARNMQNFSILSQLGATNKPIMLKRGMSATIEDLLLSSEYILAAGNPQVILCERGIRTYETYTRNTLDISCIPAIKEMSHLPVIVDPSHSGGRRELVQPLSLAGIAAGADGIMVEVHPNPDRSICDAQQAISFKQYQQLHDTCSRVATAINRKIQ